MAIVSISRIQHRRGLQQDLPQLASAELGWSIDQQRLFIGNGSLSEGSPKLGNTEILTEHSDILQLAQTYTFKNEDAGYTPVTGGRTNRFSSVAYGTASIYNPLTQAYDAADIYVAVGNSGSLLTSIDAETWSPVYGGVSSSLNSVCYGAGKFVAVGANGTIIYSTDGAVWNTSSNTIFLTLTSVVYASGTITSFVATSSTGDMINSADGITWASVPGVSGYSLNAVDYYNGLLVTVGNNGTVFTSTNATAWTPASSPTIHNLKTVKWTGDQWIIGGEYSTVLVSLDGLNWGYGYTDTFRASATNGTLIVFVGDGGVIYTTTGTALSIATSPTTWNLLDVVYNPYVSKFVAVGANGVVITSADGLTWALESSGTTEDLNKLVYDPANNFVAVVGTTGTILTSSNLSTWAVQTSGTTENLYGIAIWPDLANYTYIVVGDNGTIITSPNTSSWTAKTSGIINDLQSVVVANLGGGTYKAVAVGTSGAILTSSNAGLSWILATSGTSEELHGINYITWTYNFVTSSAYFAVGNNGMVLTSTNATSWTILSDVPATNHLFSVNYEMGNFWITGSVGYSTIYGGDLTLATTLTSQSLAVIYNSLTGYNGPTFYGSAYGNSRYVIVGQYDSILASIDGQNFVSQTQKTFSVDNINNADLFSIIFVNGKFVAVGNKGIVLTSTDGIVWSGISYGYGDSRTVRTIQHKLDDIVSVKDFGAKGDGITDDTEAINRALYELYCKVPTNAARKILHVPGGRYIISDGINVPSNAVIKGEGSNNSVFVQTADPSFVSYVMTTADSKQQIGSQIGLNGAQLPSDIYIADVGLESSYDGVWLYNANRVTFDRVRFTGGTNLPTGVGNEWTGLYIIGATLTTPTDINVLDCYFEKYNYGVFQADTEYSRNIVFNSTTFTNMYDALKLTVGGGMVDTMTISNCVFDLVYHKAIYTNYATNITSTFNSYRDVANEYAGSGSAAYVVIDFGSASAGCASINDQFDRSQAEAYSSFPWVYGNSKTVMLASGHELRIGLWEQAGGELYTLSASQTNQPVGLTYQMNDSSFNQKIQYLITRSGDTRSGILFLTYNPTSGRYNIDDDSSQTGDVGIVFSLTSDGTTLSLDYTSTSGSVATLVIAESYLDVTW